MRRLRQPPAAAPLTGRWAGALLPPPPLTEAVATAQVGSPLIAGRTSSPAKAALSTRESTPPHWIDPFLCGCRSAQPRETRILSTPPLASRSKCSLLKVVCGTTPQKLAGSACALVAKVSVPSSASTNASAALLLIG